MLTDEELTLRVPAVDFVEARDASRDVEDTPAPEDDAPKSESESDDESSGEEWEVESFYEETMAMQGLGDEQLRNGGRFWSSDFTLRRLSAANLRAQSRTPALSKRLFISASGYVPSDSPSSLQKRSVTMP